VHQDYDPDRYTLRERAAAACKTARMLEEMSGEPVIDEPTVTPQEVQAALDPKTPLPASKARDIVTTPENAVYVNEILRQHDMMVVQSAAQLRTYITNRLIQESDHSDAKVRIKALELLGKITDVGLFTEKTEVTTQNKATSELQTILRDKLRKLSGKEEAIDAVEIKPIRDISIADELRSIKRIVPDAA